MSQTDILVYAGCASLIVTGLIIRIGERRKQKQLPARASPSGPEGFTICGIHLGWPDSGIVVTGSSGYGKTFFARSIEAQAINQWLPCLFACPKPTDANEVDELCRQLNASDRFVRLKPGSPYRINLLKYLTEMPGGSSLLAAQFLARLNDIASRAEGTGNHGEAFWMTMFETALVNAIELCILATGEASMELVKDALISSPGTPEDALPAKLFGGDPENFTICAKMILLARENQTPENQRRVKRATEFFLNEFSSLGYKARGAIISMVNAILGRFLLEPFYSALCEESTLTPEMIEAGRLVVALDYDLLTYETPGRMFQLAWIMLYQGYCLRRPAANAPRSLIVRDEYAYFSHPGYDAIVAAVSRSQRALHLDLFQDFDLMEQTYGGGPKAKNEALSSWSNHGVKLMFHQNNPDSAEVQSRLTGDVKEIMLSGGSNGRANRESGDLRDGWLGVNQSMHWSEQYARAIRPEFYSTLPVGVAVLHAHGEFQVLDMRE
ncbi:hypothetical protein [Tautonia plasticadhaerens]|uniref:TraD/TraG TraM recognition site domain-containing protein n=1 Tax=Tautonia plasticadhaerens TaxID=2527974 RepID=A0A518H2D3_9BACT|nr:hypothetical protein [Tautonia plasticadhaerens]QDV34993.1 hypothetical protein ElP_28900 [Tautonia plasticadhaerens]